MKSRITGVLRALAVACTCAFASTAAHASLLDELQVDVPVAWQTPDILAAISRHPEKIPVEFWERFEFLQASGLRVIINADGDIRSLLQGVPVSWMDEDAIAIITPELLPVLLDSAAVKFVEPDYRVVWNLAVSVPDVHARGPAEPWNLDYDGSFPGELTPGGWADAYTGDGVTVAVIDSGIDGTHRDFGGFDCEDWLPYQPCESRIEAHIKISGQLVDLGIYPETEVPIEYTSELASGHGTHVAGTIAGNGYRAREAADPDRYGNDGIPVGMAPQASLLDISNGDTLWAGLGSGALWWLTNHHQDYDVKVASNSWGCLGGCEYNAGSATSEYIKTLYEAGVVVVFATGNDGSGAGSGDTLSDNAENPYAIGVANYDASNHQLASSSSRGKANAALPDPASWTPESEGSNPHDRPDIAAPGTNIWAAATLTGGAASLTPRIDGGDVTGGGANGTVPYRTMSGTSMATPHVSGAAALLFDACPDASSLDVFRALFAGANASLLRNTGGAAFTDANRAQSQGYGALDVAASLQWMFENTFCSNSGPVDSDGDGLLDSQDNCPNISNADQLDVDGDGTGDACDADHTDGPLADSDYDGVINSADVCPGHDDNLDADGDGIPDGCDTGQPSSNVTYFFVGGSGAVLLTDPETQLTTYPMSTAGHGNEQAWHTTVGSWNMAADDNAFVPTFATADSITVSDETVIKAVAYVDYAFPNGVAIECTLQAQLLDGQGVAISDAPRTATTAPGSGYGLTGYEEIEFVFAVAAGTYEGLKLQYGTSGVDCGSFPMDTTWGVDALAGRLLISGAPTGADSDGDGVPDSEDACPGFDDFADQDGDGLADGCDADRDGDGVANDSDAFPDDPTETADQDGDGIGDNADPDNNDGPNGDLDGDGVDNANDFCPGYDDRVDTDGDGIPDGCDNPDAYSVDITSPADGDTVESSVTVSGTVDRSGGTANMQKLMYQVPDGAIFNVTTHEDSLTPELLYSSSIGPGTPIGMSFDGEDFPVFICTSNFVWKDQAGKVYLGAAGHCFLPPTHRTTHGETTDIPTYDPSNVRVFACYADCAFGGFSSTVAEIFLGNYVELGEVAYARQMPKDGNLAVAGEGVGWDFGIVEIPTEYYDYIDPSMPGWGGPEDVWSDDSFLLPLLLHGNAAYYGETFPQKTRIGESLGTTDGRSWDGVIPSWGGDSGSAVSILNDPQLGPEAMGLLTHGTGVSDPVLGAGVTLMLTSGTIIPQAIQMARDDAGLCLRPLMAGEDAATAAGPSSTLGCEVEQADPSVVEVRVDDGPWTTASSDWAAGVWVVDLEGLADGDHVIEARLVRQGIVLASDSISVTVADTWTGCTLENGVAMSLNGVQDDQILCRTTLPAGATTLDVAMSGPACDVEGTFCSAQDWDLYVRRGEAPTIDSYDCRPYLTSNNEACQFADPAADYWFVMIHAYQGDGAVDVLVSHDAPIVPPDSDGDGVPDSEDACPGFDDNADVDGDGIADGCDADNNDGPLGDADGDGVPNQDDVCAGYDDNLDQDGDGIPDGCDVDETAAIDADQDGVPNGMDNCPGHSNADQTDMDGDGKGDVCDSDRDGDGASNGRETAQGTDPDNADDGVR